MHNYIVYAHINMQNEKRYIGITNNPSRRWGANGCHYKDSPKFWCAIQKYGWNNFHHVVLADNLSREEARIKEIEYIQKYDSIANGYNISEGGDTPPVFYGADNHNYHNHFSDETRKKMSLNHADFSKGKHPRAKSVLCVETGIMYSTISEAADAVKISRSCIRDVCNGKQEMSAGYHWKFIDSDL